MEEYNSIINEVMNSSSELVDAVENACSGIPMDARPPSLREYRHKFAQSLVAFRDCVIRDVVSYTKRDRAESQSGKLGRNVGWGSKKPWVSKPPFTRTSS